MRLHFHCPDSAPGCGGGSSGSDSKLVLPAPQIFGFESGNSFLRVKINPDKSERVMTPSASTRLLIQHLKITPGESVLDMGAGTGVIGIVARKLKAGPVTFSDISEECIAEAKKNAKMNQIVSNTRFVVGHMFESLQSEKFDHIICNPPSIPSPKPGIIPAYSESGWEGRDFHKSLQAVVEKYLTHEGKITFVQGTLSNFDLTIRNLEKLGFDDVTICQPCDLKFAPWYNVKHMEELARQGKAEFKNIGGVRYEQRYVISATLGG